MKRVLVTGATGFIGYHTLPPLLKSGYEVHAVSRSKSPKEPSGIHWHHIDLLDGNEVHALVGEVRPTHLLHAAWYLEPGSFYHSPLNCEWVEASLRILKHFHAVGGERCVMVGSGFEYDFRYGYCTENLTPCNPTTVYGRCKNALHELLSAFADATDLSTAWARIFFLYGPGEKSSRLVASVVRALLLEEPARCSSGEQIRDYLHVKDAAEALVKVLGSDVSGAINVASGSPVTLRQITTCAADIVGRPDLLRLGAVETPKDTPPMAVANVTRLNDEVDWRPRFDLESGLRDTVSWWSEQLELDKNA